jgi:hypothetical protein
VVGEVVEVIGKNAKGIYQSHIVKEKKTKTENK